jgi:hypothetical protein
MENAQRQTSNAERVMFLNGYHVRERSVSEFDV